MATKEAKRLKPADVSADQTAYTALKKIAGYKPSNAQAALPKLATLYKTREDDRTSEVHAEKALGTARDNAKAAEWAFHSAMIAAKDHVRAQFGRDSNELQSLGLKKASERKSPKKKNAAAKV